MPRSKQYRSPGRGTEVNGRSKANNRHVRLHYWMMASAAFRALKAHEVRVLIELYSLFNGNNNGHLYLSCRQAEERCKISKNTAGRCFHRLQELGFIRRRADEPENYRLREANRWILTEFDFGSRSATKDFMHWVPEEKQKERPKSDTARPKTGTNLNTVRAKTPCVSHYSDEMGVN